MSIKGAFDQIATWTISGVTVWGLDDLAVPPVEADLPLIFPRLDGTGGEAYQPLGVNAASGQVVVHVRHELAVTGLGLGVLQERFYDVLTHIDNYLAVVAGDWFLDDNLVEPLTIADTRAGVIEVGGVLYWGVSFRHRWVLKVDTS